MTHLAESKYPHLFSLIYMMAHGEVHNPTEALKPLPLSEAQNFDNWEALLAGCTFAEVVDYIWSENPVPPKFLALDNYLRWCGIVVM